MAQYSVVVKQQWTLRVTSGSMVGKEFALNPGRYTLGSRAPATIIVNQPGIAPQHLTLDVAATSASLTDTSGSGFQLNGTATRQAQVRPGDRVQVGSFEFQLVNPGLLATAQGAPTGLQTGLQKLPLGLVVGGVVFVIALLLYVLMAATGITNLVPATLLAMSAVVPAGMMTHVVSRYDRTGISFRTLGVTFLLGGSVGLICTLLQGIPLQVLSFGALAIPMFAGLFEEPAKLLATAWRWKHPVYDRPMDGLIIGLMSGFGFAVFETAGYGFTALLEGGTGSLVSVMVLRGLLSPFGHGLWCGIVSAAFWQAGRTLKDAARNRTFWLALLKVVGLHALWNLGLIGFLGAVASAVLTLLLFRAVVRANGYQK